MKVILGLFFPIMLFAQKPTVSAIDTNAITVSVSQFDSLVEVVLRDSVHIKSDPTPKQYIMVLRLHNTLAWNKALGRNWLPPKTIYMLLEKTYTIAGFINHKYLCLPDLEMAANYYSPSYGIVIGRPNHFNSRYHLFTE